ncbi:MAG: FkbM family methyltransferase [Opitutae bacterium]|nr:FkbM family methyltransferase [Opitutae bacterium]
MNLELGTDLLLADLLARLDPASAGTVVEIGLGRVNFTFQWARPRGHRCFAVEPLPTPVLRDACARHGVPLVEAAVAATDGEVDIFLGAVNGHDLPDVSSLNPRWWGASANARRVRAVTLPTLAAELALDTVTLLKIDTEGSEPAVVAGLHRIAAPVRPALVCFEYGGGGPRRDARGGWSEEFFAGTQSCLRDLQALGYRQALLLDESRAEPQLVDLAATADFAALFAPESTVGNLIALRDPIDAAWLAAHWRGFAPQFARALRRERWSYRWTWLRHHATRVRTGLLHRIGVR